MTTPIRLRVTPRIPAAPYSLPAGARIEWASGYRAFLYGQVIPPTIGGGYAGARYWDQGWRRAYEATLENIQKETGVPYSPEEKMIRKLFASFTVRQLEDVGKIKITRGFLR